MPCTLLFLGLVENIVRLSNLVPRSVRHHTEKLMASYFFPKKLPVELQGLQFRSFVVVLPPKYIVRQVVDGAAKDSEIERIIH